MLPNGTNEKIVKLFNEKTKRKYVALIDVVYVIVDYIMTMISALIYGLRSEINK